MFTDLDSPWSRWPWFLAGVLDNVARQQQVTIAALLFIPALTKLLHLQAQSFRLICVPALWTTRHWSGQTHSDVKLPNNSSQTADSKVSILTEIHSSVTKQTALQSTKIQLCTILFTQEWPLPLLDWQNFSCWWKNLKSEFYNSLKNCLLPDFFVCLFSTFRWVTNFIWLKTTLLSKEREGKRGREEHKGMYVCMCVCVCVCVRACVRACVCV